tara:strand:+ start:1074 stop:1259 length:186 start_codon:yes stop_codon:yes gene_type:complete
MKEGNLVRTTTPILGDRSHPDIPEGTLMIVVSIWGAGMMARLVYPPTGHEYDVAVHTLTKL